MSLEISKIEAKDLLIENPSVESKPHEVDELKETFKVDGVEYEYVAWAEDFGLKIVDGKVYKRIQG